MCGIAGFLGFGHLGPDKAYFVGEKMGRAIHHRGPDDTGIWQDEAAQLVIVHRRLSILDPSPAGHQPMMSASRRYVIAFNGEIYNHLALRQELQKNNSDNKPQWCGHSDTETFLACIEAWGLEKSLERLIGMFAFALWDKQERILYVARDRMGEKPLYYGWQDDVFLFGSELKAFKAHPCFKKEIFRDAITLQLRHNYIPAPYSIYKGINKLLPGHFLKLKAPYKEIDKKIQSYWSFPECVMRGRTDLFTGDDNAAINALDHLLRDAITQQMVADVPLGAFLSGGVDSSTIVALMQAQSNRPIKTFTIGFNETKYNEAEHAKAVAQYLGTEHTELYITPQQALDVIPSLPTLYDEPFSDSSQIPTFLVSQMTRQHVTVSLSGDAADELFGGYGRYCQINQLWNRTNLISFFTRRMIAKGLCFIRPELWNILGHLIAVFTIKKKRWNNLSDHIAKSSAILVAENTSDFYAEFVRHWLEPESIVVNGYELPTQITHPEIQLNSITEQMMALDSMAYLPDDILVKVDRAAMGTSLETRAPFLDHRVVEFAWRLPLSMKVRNHQGKWILKQVLNKYIPKELIERPKMGFGVPIDSWLRGPLRDWGEALLDETRLRQEGFFNPIPIRKKWLEHISGKQDWHYHLWDVLMFQAWLEQQ